MGVVTYCNKATYSSISRSVHLVQLFLNPNTSVFGLILPSPDNYTQQRDHTHHNRDHTHKPHLPVVDSALPHVQCELLLHCRMLSPTQASTHHTQLWFVCGCLLSLSLTMPSVTVPVSRAVCVSSRTHPVVRGVRMWVVWGHEAHQKHFSAHHYSYLPAYLRYKVN